MAIKKTTLSNGLTILTDTIPTVETVSIGIWLNAGSRDELPEHNGTFHFLEHMAFKGTKKRTAYDIALEIENVGGYMNAWTSRENTVWYTKVLHKDTPLAVDILSDIFLNPTLEPQEFEREQSVIIQEIRQAQDMPDDAIFDLFQKTAWPEQPIGLPIAGTEKIIANISRNTLLNYMENYWDPKKIIVVSSGKLDHEILSRMIEKKFGQIQPKNTYTQQQKPCYHGGESHEKRQLEQIQLVLGFEGIPTKDNDYYAASIFSILFGGGMSSRLFQEIREKKGLVYTIHSFLSAYHDCGVFGIYAVTGEKEISELLSTFCQETKKACYTTQQEEIERAKNQLLAGILMEQENTWFRCQQMARQFLTYGTTFTVKEIQEKIQQVNLEQIHKTAKRLINEKITFSTIGETKEIPSLEEIKNILR